VVKIDKLPTRDRSREKEREGEGVREGGREGVKRRKGEGKRGRAPLHCICRRIQSVPKVTLATIESIDC